MKNFDILYKSKTNSKWIFICRYYEIHAEACENYFRNRLKNMKYNPKGPTYDQKIYNKLFEIDNIKPDLQRLIAVLSNRIEEQIKQTKQDIFDYQNKYAEPLISGVYWEQQWWRFHIEGAGDIIRELSKYEYVDNGYIFEKINRLKKFIVTQSEPGVAYVDTYKYLMDTKDKNNIEKLKKIYEKQPVYTEPQIKAKELVLDLLAGKLYAVKKDIQYFEQFRGHRERLIQKQKLENEGFILGHNLGKTMENKINKSLEMLLKEHIRKYINEQYVESEYEKVQNQPPEYNKFAMIKLLNKHQELKREFNNYKKLYSRRDGNTMSLEIMFRNFVLNDPSFSKEYREIIDDFQGSTSNKLPSNKK